MGCTARVWFGEPETHIVSQSRGRQHLLLSNIDLLLSCSCQREEGANEILECISVYIG